MSTCVSTHIWLLATATAGIDLKAVAAEPVLPTLPPVSQDTGSVTALMPPPLLHVGPPVQ